MPRTQDDITAVDPDPDSNADPDTHLPILTDGGENDDSLTRSSRRLGDRFSQDDSADEESTEDTASTQHNGQTDDSVASGATEDAERESEPEPEPDPDSEPEPEWKPATIYLTEDTRKQFNRFLMRVQLNYPEIEEVNKRDIHEGVILAAMEHPEEVAAIVEQKTDS